VEQKLAAMRYRICSNMPYSCRPTVVMAGCRSPTYVQSMWRRQLRLRVRTLCSATRQQVRDSMRRIYSEDIDWTWTSEVQMSQPSMPTERSVHVRRNTQMRASNRSRHYCRGISILQRWTVLPGISSAVKTTVH